MFMINNAGRTFQYKNCKGNLESEHNYQDFPTPWKTAEVSQLHKKNSKDDPNNWMQAHISLTILSNF